MVERVNTVWLFLSSAFWGIVCAPILNAFTSDPIADVINSMILSTGIIFLFSFCFSRGIKEQKSFLWHFGFAFLCAVFVVVFQYRGMVFFGL